MAKRRLTTGLQWLAGLLVAGMFFGPFYIVLLYSVKSKAEMATSRLAFPKSIEWSNFTRGMEMSNFGNAFKNSVIVTLITVALLTIVSAMAAYIIARKNSFFYKLIYYLFLAAMIIPFQVIMTPLYFNLKSYGLINSLTGLVLVKTSFQIAFTVLIIAGFVESVPRELEMAASIDGAGIYTTFWRIVFPLMRPYILTSIVLNFMNVWNDFQISVVLLINRDVHTVPMTQFTFFGGKKLELNLAFAVFLISMIPVVSVYLLLQKYIVQGITAGAVKG